MATWTPFSRRRRSSQWSVVRSPWQMRRAILALLTTDYQLRTNLCSSPAKADCGCAGKSSSASPARRGNLGVFEDASEACAAAHEAFLQLQKAGVAARVKIVEIVKAMAEANAETWGKLELDETKIGR